MALHCLGVQFRASHFSGKQLPKQKHPNIKCFTRLITAGLEEITQNQVLTSAAFAGISAQLLKPLSSSISGKGFNWKLIFRSGGMPSSHSASVAAAATILGLERGLSDSIFGFSAVIAAIVMYDAQGVRRAVGKQAEVINTMVFTYVLKPNTTKSKVESRVGVLQMQEQENEICPPNVNGPFSRSLKFFQTAEGLPSMRDGEVSIQEIGNEDGWRHIPLKESVGHTKLQVLAGALFGVTMTTIIHKLVN